MPRRWSNAHDFLAAGIAAGCQAWYVAERPDDHRAVAGEIALDATQLTFIDHRALMTLDEHARRRGAVAAARGGAPDRAPGPDPRTRRAAAAVVTAPRRQATVSAP
jgi:hypothetical protein